MELNEYMTGLMELTEDIEEDDIADTISLSLLCVCNQLDWEYYIEDGMVIVLG